MSLGTRPARIEDRNRDIDGNSQWGNVEMEIKLFHVMIRASLIVNFVLYHNNSRSRNRTCQDSTTLIATLSATRALENSLVSN
jgi:hypothetical protein